jgi:hypothetical protein
MRGLMMSCFLFLASAAFAEDAPASVAEGPGSGAYFEVDVLGANSLGNVNALSTGLGNSTIVISPSAGAGFQFGENVIFADITLLGFGPGTNVGFSIDPTYRRYLRPLQTGQVSPLAQVGLSFGMISPASGQVNILFGITGGAGAEWLFVKNVGLVVDALLEYVHTGVHVAGGFGGTTNADVVGIAGNVGLTVHW